MGLQIVTVNGEGIEHPRTPLSEIDNGQLEENEVNGDDGGENTKNHSSFIPDTDETDKKEETNDIEDIIKDLIQDIIGDIIDIIENIKTPTH